MLALDQIVSTIQDTAFYHSSTFKASEMAILILVLDQWPVKYVFPVLDLVRLVLVHPHGPEAINEARLKSLIPRILRLGVENEPLEGEKGTLMTTRMLVLKVLANMFLHDEARAVLVAHKTDVLNTLPSFLTYHHKLVALSFSTVLLKYVVLVFIVFMVFIDLCSFARAILTCKEAFSMADSIVVVSLAADLLNGSYTVEELGDDTMLRLLVTVGTLVGFFYCWVILL